MGFSSYGERLALLVDGNSAGAVREIKKVGDTSEKEFSRASSAQQKWSHGLLTGGAAAVGFAVVVAKGLGHTVSAFEEQQAASTKLDATMSKMPQLAGANRKALDDLAQSTVDKTRVDDEAVTTTESMLGQFKLTEAQILKLTPLIVDYSVKTGKDMVTATKAVEGAFLGKTRALAADGVVLDKAKLKTDAYNTVVQGLARTVGGFAERDGKTFSGRLAIIHNQLENFEEGVGAGVVQQVGSFTGAIGGLASGFGHMSQGAEEATGRVLTVATGSIAALGGVSLLAGGVLKLKDALIAESVAGEASQLTLAGSIGVYGLVAAAAVALAKTVKDITWPDATSVNIANTGNDMADALLGAASTAAGAHDQLTGLSTALADYISKQSDITNESTGLISIRNLGHSYEEVAAIVTGSKAGIDKYVAGLHLTGDNAGRLSKTLHALHDSFQISAQGTLTQLSATGQLTPELVKQAIAVSTSKDGTVDYVSALRRATGDSQSLAAASGDVTQQLNLQHRAFQTLIDQTLAHRDAVRNEQRAVIGSEQSTADLTEKLKALTQARKDHAAGSPEVQQAERDVQLAMIDVSQSSDDAKKSIEDLATKEVGAKDAADAVAHKHDEYVAALQRIRDTLKPGSALYVAVTKWIDHLAEVPTAITTHFDVTGGNADGTHAGPIKHFAAGGTLGPGELGIVGDTGGKPEIIEGPGTVHNPADTARILGARTATAVVEEHFHLHVTPTFGTNAQQFARDLADVIVRDQRSGGPISLALRKARAA